VTSSRAAVHSTPIETGRGRGSVLDARHRTRVPDDLRTLPQHPVSTQDRLLAAEPCQDRADHSLDHHTGPHVMPSVATPSAGSGKIWTECQPHWPQ